MKDIELKEHLMRGAREQGICAEGYGHLRGYDREGLISYYLANPDWCIERGFPSLDMLNMEFSDIEGRGVYVGKDFEGEVFDKMQVYIFHDCRGVIKVGMDYDNAIIPMLYFANGCRIRVECEQDNSPAIRVPLYVADDCEVDVVQAAGCSFKFNIIKRIEG